MSEPLNEPVVWIIDSEHWPRAYLRAELIERGYDAVGYEKLAEALAALRRAAIRKPRVIVLELRDQTLTQIALRALAGTGIPVIAMGGAVELSEPVTEKLRCEILLRRPVTLGAVADAIERILVAHPPAERHP